MGVELKDSFPMYVEEGFSGTTFIDTKNVVLHATDTPGGSYGLCTISHNTHYIKMRQFLYCTDRRTITTALE